MPSSQQQNTCSVGGEGLLNYDALMYECCAAMNSDHYEDKL